MGRRYQLPGARWEPGPGCRHPWAMRLLCLLCLGTALFAQAGRSLPEPGRDAAFLARILPEVSDGPGHPWHLYREPPVSASAVVEVVGEYTAEELRQVRFNAFMAWFREDLRRFLHDRLGGREQPSLASDATAGPGPRMVPLGAPVRF